MKRIPARGTAQKKRVRRSNAKAPGFDDNMGTAGRSLVFDIAFSETWETSRLSPGFSRGFPRILVQDHARNLCHIEQLSGMMR